MLLSYLLEEFDVYLLCLIRLQELNRPIEKVLDELMDGDVIVFQRLDLLNDPSLELSSAKDYLRDVANRVEVWQQCLIS